MTTRNSPPPAGGSKWASLWRLLLRVRHTLSPGGDAPRRGDAELCRLSGLPSCCFSHVADRQK